MDILGHLCAGIIVVWMIVTYIKSIRDDNDKDGWDEGVGEV